MKNYDKLKYGKLKPAPIRPADKATANAEADYDNKMSELDYPGTKGVALPQSGKQQVSGFKFSGTY
jgi:hypothetical protein